MLRVGYPPEAPRERAAGEENFGPAQPSERAAGEKKKLVWRGVARSKFGGPNGVIGRAKSRAILQPPTRAIKNHAQAHLARHSCILCLCRCLGRHACHPAALLSCFSAAIRPASCSIFSHDSARRAIMMRSPFSAARSARSAQPPAPAARSAPPARSAL